MGVYSTEGVLSLGNQSRGNGKAAASKRSRLQEIKLRTELRTAGSSEDGLAWA